MSFIPHPRLRARRDQRRGAGAPTTAFVLAGGASLGAIQAGMLWALYERELTPDLLVATSAGALNAGFIASRPRTPDTIGDLVDVWLGLRRDHVFPISARTVIAGIANQRDHLVPDRGVRDLVRRHLQFELLEQAPIPLHLVAFDLLAGKEALLSTGPALESIVAACAIPSVLPPVTLSGRLLVDGGVVNNTPVSHAVALGAKRIFVLPTEDPSTRGLTQAPHGALDAAVHAFRLLTSARLQADLARYAGVAELIVLPAPNAGRVQPTDFSHPRELIDDAYRAVIEMLDDSQNGSERGADDDSSTFDHDRPDPRRLGRLPQRRQRAGAVSRHHGQVARPAFPHAGDELSPPTELTVSEHDRVEGDR